MKQFSYLFNVLVFSLCISCNQGNVSTPAAKINSEGYETINKGSFDKMVKKNAEGIVVEEGHTVNGLKTGAWLTYDAQGNLIGITNYMNGKLNGPNIIMNNRGQIIEKQYYDADVKDGPFGIYKFGRAEKEGIYRNGKIDAVYTEYYGNGKKQKEIQYNNGVVDGMMTYFKEDDESVMLQYEYKNGEKLRQVDLGK